MTQKPGLAIQWPLFVSCAAVLISMLACTVSGPVPTAEPEQASLRLGDHAIEGQAVNGEWVPLASESTFETIGILESTDPWQLPGITFETRESTEVEADLQSGDLVRVKGIILEDGTWVALSIQRVQDEVAPTIILIGTVNSTDPWVVNGITLNVTEETIITGDITVGMLVRVEILLGEDGTWEVLSITPLSELPEQSGCVTVLATIVSVDGDQVQFEGWPSPVTVEDGVQIENDNTNDGSMDLGSLTPGKAVLVTLCSSADGLIVITQITILNIQDGDETGSPGQEKVLICHKPDKNGGHTISVAEPAVPAHLAHGDTLGACP